MSHASSSNSVPARCHALIPCAGSGSRSGRAGPKQYELLAGRRLVDHTLDAFLAVPQLASVWLVLAPDDDSRFRADPRLQRLCVGGASRAASVHNGLKALRTAGVPESDWVLVHDAARCLVTTAQIDALIDACQGDSVGGLLAHKLADTLKTASDGPGGVRVAATVDRSDKWLAQTPQMFRLGVLLRALEQVGAAATDEASAIEAMGLRPRLVPGGAQNFKVTYPEDFALAEAVLAQRLHGGTLDRFGGQRGLAASEAINPFFARATQR